MGWFGWFLIASVLLGVALFGIAIKKSLEDFAEEMNDFEDE